MNKNITSAILLLLPFCTIYGYNSYDTLSEMRRENEYQMDRMLNRLYQENQLQELRRANDEQERFNRSIIQGQKKRGFGR